MEQAPDDSSIEVIETRGTVFTDPEFTSDNELVVPANVSSQQRSVSDVVAQLVGVEHNGQGGLFQSYNIRGFSRWRIKSEVDGIPIITDRRAGNSLSFLAPELISNVYLQKGPGAALYGSGAMGGVLSASTIKEHSQIGMKYQPEDNARSVFAQLASDSSSVAALYRSADDSEAPDGTPLNSQYEQSIFKGSIEKQWRGLDIEGATLLSQGKDIGKSTSTFPDQRISIYPGDDHWLSQIQVSRTGEWKLKLFHHRQEWSSDIVRLTNKQFDRRNLTTYKSQTYGGLGWMKVSGVTLGMEWLARRNVDISEQEYDQSGERLWETQKISADQDNVSAFAHYKWQFQDLHFTSGLRFDTVDVRHQGISRDEQAWSFSLVAAYKLSGATRIEAELASAFRFPSVSELFFSGETPRGATLGNPQLEPEQSLNGQLYLSHQFSPDIGVKLNVYRYEVEDYIERFRLNQELRSFRNTDDATIDGGEVSVIWDVKRGIHLSLSYQYQKGETVNGEFLDDIQAPAFKWRVQWQPDSLLDGKLMVNSTMKYRLDKKRTGPSEQILDVQFIWHLSMDYAYSEQTSFGVDVANVTDADYFASADDQAPLQPQRAMSIRWKHFF